MDLVRISLVALLATATAVGARPLVTSSEETYARICLQRAEAPARIVDACDAALSEAGLTRSQRVELLIARADGFMWLEDHAAAEAGYRAAIDVDPLSADAWNGLGWTLRETGGEAAAFEVFETSIAAEVTVEGLGGKAATGRKTGRLSGEEARELLRAALTIDPRYIWAMREIGWSLLLDKRGEDAAAAFGEALEIEPDDRNARYGYGRALLATGDADKALETFNGLLDRNSGDFAARVYRIISLRDLGRNAQALRDSDRLIQDFPDRNTGYIERGMSLLALERRSEAIETYERAESLLGPDNALLYWHADALASDGQFSRAMAVIDRSLALSGVDHSDHLLKSYIALELGDYATVRTAAEASLGTGVEDPWAYYYIAISMVHSGSTSEGLRHFARAIETGLPKDRIGAFAKELISAGRYAEAAQLRLRY